MGWGHGLRLLRRMIIRTEPQRLMAIRRIESRKLPFTVEIKKGEHRSLDANRLQFMWFRESEEQGDMSAEDYRAEAKLRHAIPILRAENEEFRQVYDRLIKPLSYEDKISLMRSPVDFPATRLFDVSQMSRYLNEVHKDLSSRGIILTEPNPL